MFNFLKNLFWGFSYRNDPVLSTLHELEEYNRESWKKIIEDLSRPRKKSDFEIQAEKKLGLDLPEYH